MNNAVTKVEQLPAVNHNAAIFSALKNSLYPGAADASVHMVLDYCRAAGLDPMTKPVHIVPIWDAKSGAMRDVVMPGVGLYRTQASRTGEFAGMTEPEFGPEVSATLGGFAITYPEWARVTVKRALASGIVAEFTAREYWLENYAVKGGKEKSIAPNAMWAKRPRGQLGKCAAAQALRIAFPELGAQPTAEEMEGKEMDVAQLPQVQPEYVPPVTGAWSGLDEETQAAFQDYATRVTDLCEVNDAESAADYIETLGLEGEPKLALWSRFDAATKSALKDEYTKRKKGAR